MKRRFLAPGLVITAICCFTPVLVITVTALGLGWLSEYLDYGLTPLLGFFTVALTYVLHKHHSFKYSLPIGGLVFVGFVIRYYTWDQILGILVLLGGGIGYYVARARA